MTLLGRAIRGQYKAALQHQSTKPAFYSSPFAFNRNFATAVAPASSVTTTSPTAPLKLISQVQRNILTEAQRCIILAGLAQNPNVPQYDNPIGTPNNDMRRFGDVPHGYRHGHLVNSQHTRNTAQYTKKLLPIIYYAFLQKHRYRFSTWVELESHLQYKFHLRDEHIGKSLSCWKG
ncbi:unnamed protein product [Amoebophrya sp. A120]|nr:unnamed protein product [Amoebophrya sp. A120]|eukprot:GSA120T00007317001.1